MQHDVDLFTLAQMEADPQHDYVLARFDGNQPLYRRVILDEDLLRTIATEEWLKVLAQLWVAYGKPLDEEQFVIYQEHLAELPMGLLDAALKRVIREHKFNSVPTLAEVWDAVRKELHNPADLDRAILEWDAALWSNVVLLGFEEIEYQGAR